MSGVRSVQKGKAAERELVRLCRAMGLAGARSVAPLEAAAAGAAPDVDGLPGVWLEAKSGRAPRVLRAVAQARALAGERVPVVAWRRDRGEWWAALPLGELLDLYRSAVFGLPTRRRFGP